MVDSRQKGRAGELQARDILRTHTGLEWERVPMSGALDPKHKLKGDLYVPGVNLKYCVEVKFYKDDHLTSKILTSKAPKLMEWWEQTEREASQIGREPLLLFKYNRSKWFVMHRDFETHVAMEDDNARALIYLPDNLYIAMLHDFCDYVEDWTE
jgi:Holliday junction resolvase